MFRFILSLWLGLACAANAQVKEYDILTPAVGRLSVAFVLDRTTVRPDIGDRVEIWGADKGTTKQPAKRIAFSEGLVLGLAGGVVFVELAPETAVRVAEARVTKELHLRKTAEARADFVAERRAQQEDGTVFNYAPPWMYSVVLTLDIDAAQAEAWSPGDTIVFHDAHKKERTRRVKGVPETSVTYRDIEALFSAIRHNSDGTYDVTVLTYDRHTEELMRAQLQNRLFVSEDSVKHPRLAKQDRSVCYTRTRRGTEIRVREIPCG
jgi:hypothetical protein